MSVRWGGRGPGHLSRWPKATSSGPTPAEETTALLARMSVQPDATRKGLINDLIVSLKDAGVWAKLECLWVPAAHDAQAARLNWISSSFSLTAVGSPAFTTDRGYAGNASSSYLNTNWNGALSSIALRDSTSIGAYVNAGTDIASSSRVLLGFLDVNRTIITPRNGSSVLSGSVNDGAGVVFSGSIASVLGFTAFSRTTSTTIASYKNGSFVSNAASNSTARASGSTFLCGYSNNGTLANASDLRYAMAFAGAGLDATEMSDLYTATNTYLTAIGAD